ncbi:MAG: lysozyme inhibitor LprI family protein [Flavobacterium sp.]|uniref:lysozyme inhibitor LprI family protein n=1 Tax=Flavobacterium sp. TaxID=239 RepID=UPI0032656508
MKKCSYGYLHKSDSLLNVVYNKVKLKLNSTQKAKLKKEQLAWLKKRDAYFDKVIKSTLNGEEGLIGDDLRMVIADKEADFVFDRVEELIRRL